MKCKLVNAAKINPKESIKKGTVAKKIAMDQLRPFCRDILGYTLESFNGGTKFRNGDTIMARITPCLENGKTAKVSILEDDEIGFGSTEYIVFRAIEGISDADYLYYLISSPIIRDAAIKSMTGTTGRQRVQTNVLQNIEIDLPPLEWQKKSAFILRLLDDKIELNNKINKNLKQQIQIVYKLFFVERIFLDAKAKKWPNVKLGEISGLISRGITPKYSVASDHMIINQKCIHDHMIDLSFARYHNPKAINEKWLKFGDLLINSTGTGTLGRTAQVWFQPKNLTVDSHITIVRPTMENLIFYIGLWGILHENNIESLHTGSTGQTELPRDRIKTIELPLPDNKTLARFNSVILPIVTAIASNQKENQMLSKLKNSLLPKLLTNEINVSKIQLEIN